MPAWWSSEKTTLESKSVGMDVKEIFVFSFATELTCLLARRLTFASDVLRPTRHATQRKVPLQIHGGLELDLLADDTKVVPVFFCEIPGCANIQGRQVVKMTVREARRRGSRPYRPKLDMHLLFFSVSVGWMTQLVSVVFMRYSVFW